MTESASHTKPESQPLTPAVEPTSSEIRAGSDISGNALSPAPAAAGATHATLAPKSGGTADSGPAVDGPAVDGAVVGGTDEAGITRGVVPGQHPGQNGAPAQGAPSRPMPNQPSGRGDGRHGAHELRGPANGDRPGANGNAPTQTPPQTPPERPEAARSESSRAALVTVEVLKRDAEVVALLQRANEFMRTLGFTEHGQRHAGLVGHIAENVLSRLGMPERTCQLAHVAGYLHDIGNVVHRENHAQSGALMAYSILGRLNMATDETVLVLNAIGNHEEERGTAITPVSAAIIIADKADVHRSRVQNADMATFDIHDRVNYATTRSFVRVRPDERIISLELEIDTNYATVIEYFEIFLSRMTMMRQACEFLKTKFHLIINETRFT